MSGIARVSEDHVDKVTYTPSALPVNESERIAALFDLSVLDTAADADIDAITLLAADRFDAPIALVSLVETSRQWFKSAIGLTQRETRSDSSFCVHAIRDDVVFVVLDAHADPLFRSNPLVVGDPHARFYAGAPLITRSGHRIGTLCVLDTQPRPGFSDRDRRALAMMARQVMGHLELRQLRQSDSFAHLIDTTTTDAFVCADVDSRIIHWNRGAEAMFGWAACEALGQPLSLIIPNRHRAGHYNGMARLRAGAPTRLVGKTVEVPAMTREGRELPIELSLATWTDGASGPSEGYAAIIRDISDRKALEAERDAVTLRFSEQLAAIDASNDGIAITDTDGIFTFVNDAHGVMFGFASGADACGLSWRDLYSNDEVERLGQVAFPQLETERRWRGRATGTRRDGSKIEQEIALSLNSSGGLVCVTRDIGPRLAAERDQILLREQLIVVQRQEALGQIASGIAHDFNNCIAAIAGSASLIIDQGSAAARPHAQRIMAATASAGSLVQKMLALGGRTRTRERLDLRTVVGDVGELVRAGLTTSQRLVIHLPPEPLITYGDAAEVMQIVLNLGVNARDALGGSPGCIAISLDVADPDHSRAALAVGNRPTQRAAVIRVSDDGSGMAAADVPRIFNVYHTGKAGFGSGLGLAIVARLVTSAGGGIAVTTAPGAGSVFEIFWPLDQRSQPRTLPSSPPPPVSLRSLQSAGVLIAEDDPEVVATFAAVLEAAGAEVGQCQRPCDALAALRSDPDAWSLLVTDFDMPGMNGAELAAAARRIRPDLPVLLCTAIPEAARSHQGLFTAILAKPVANSMLVETAFQLLELATA